MLRSDFEEHTLWGVLDTVDERLDKIAEEGELSDIAPCELIRSLVTYVRSFRALSTTSPLLFSAVMLNNVQDIFGPVEATLDNRIIFGAADPTYMQSAVQLAESSLVALAPWPRPYAKGAQIQAMTTMYEGLLEAQRKSVDALEKAHQKLIARVDALTETTETDQTALQAQLASILTEAQAAVATVNSEKARIDEVVTNGLQAVSNVEKENTDRYKKWQDNREKAFTSDFAKLRAEMEAQKASSDETLAAFRATHQQFENLTTLAAGELIAGEFSRDARWGRIVGLIAYGFGFAFIGLGAIPLILLLSQDPDTATGAPDWGRIIVRALLAVLAGSAATVVITLGARLFRNATLSKRMDLELRSFGPFLANVTEKDNVDAARIELLDRAFGKAYGAPDADDKEEVVQVSTIMQIINAASKLVR